MNIKRIFAVLLTILGIVSLIYTAIILIDTSGGNRDIKILLVYGGLGLLFFISGIGLVKATKDES